MSYDIKELFARFLESPSREILRDILQHNDSELDQVDYKAEFIEDSSKTAKHMLAMGNSGGGMMIIGIKEKEDGFDYIGLQKTIDQSDFDNSVSPYLPDEFPYNLLTFSYPDSDFGKLKGHTIQVILIKDDPTLIPFVATKDGKEIHQSVIYARRKTKSVAASHSEITSMIERRINNSYGDFSEVSLEVHLKQLKSLFREISTKKNLNNPLNPMQEVLKVFQNYHTDFKEYEDYIGKLIMRKKRRIERILDL